MSYLGRSAKLSLKAQEKVSFLATAGQTSKTGLSYVPSFVEVYVNGILLTDTTDFTATNGNSVTFTVALALNDEVTVISLKTFTVADHYTKTEDDARFLGKAGGTMTGNLVLSAANSQVGIGTDNMQIFNSVGGSSGLVVTGVSSSTAILGNTLSNITIANGDGTANNTAALHFAREDTDGNPNYAGASIVSQFKETQVTGQYPKADLAFLTSTSANSAPSEKMRIDSSGHAIIPAGVTLGTAAGVYSAANTLDDYEEGTWTPSLGSISSSAPAGSFSHVGSYIKVGRAVHLTIYIQCNSLSSVGGGILSIDGIPFNATTADGYMPSGIPIVHSWDPARSPHGGLTFYTNNRLAFLTSNHDSGWNWEHTNTLNATTVFRCTMTYTAVS